MGHKPAPIGPSSSSGLAVQESPEFVDAWFELARLLEADRQFSEANEIYNSLIEQDPDNPDIWIRMVEGQIRAGKGQKALDYALNGPATYGYKLTAATLFLDARMYPEAEALLDGLKSDPNGAGRGAFLPRRHRLRIPQWTCRKP